MSASCPGLVSKSNQAYRLCTPRRVAVGERKARRCKTPWVRITQATTCRFGDQRPSSAQIRSVSTYRDAEAVHFDNLRVEVADNREAGRRVTGFMPSRIST